MKHTIEKKRAKEDSTNPSKTLVKITKEDVIEEILFRESVVVYYVLWTNPLHIIECFVQRILKNLS